MNDLIKLLTGWQKVAGKWQRPSPEKPKSKKVAKPGYPVGASEAEKLRMAQERIQKKRRSAAPAAKAAKPRDRGGPFGRLPGKIGAGMKKVAGEKPKKDAKKPWYRKSLYDLF